MVSLDAKTADVSSLYKLLIGSIVPRPIAWISTISKKGTSNLAPFSFFNGVSSRPPCVMVSIAQKPDGSRKDTLNNIMETGEFVVNSVSEQNVVFANETSADYPTDISEIEACGIETIASKIVRPPRVKSSLVQLECRLYGKLVVGDGGTGSSTIIVGEILMAHAQPEVYEDGKINYEKYKPVARLGGRSYLKGGKPFELSRPQLKG